MDWWYAGMGIYILGSVELGGLAAIYFYINSAGLRETIVERYPETGHLFIWLALLMICGAITVLWPCILAIMVIRRMFCGKRREEAQSV
ncbi:MAG: hypothetical protein Q8L10_00720 [Candidatus Moranbacteria bacterium]|nr:hypothetical protein [Candidatus Moranbacteria bacterium]